MAYQYVKDIAVVTGTYEKDGETKKRYENVGRVMRGDDGNEFFLLKATFNPAGIPRKEGSDSITLSLFDPKPKDGQQQRPAQQAQASAKPVNPDDIPF